LTRCRLWTKIAASVLLLALLGACGQRVHPSAQPSLPTTPTPRPVEDLTVEVLYPKSDTSVEMGQTMSAIVRVTDGGGQPVNGGEARIEVRDPRGAVMVDTRLRPGDDGVYRTGSWLVPHRTVAGQWAIRATVRDGSSTGQGETGFDVEPSTSEKLLSKYGFWIDAPDLGGIQPSLVAERGDAANGLIRWGGVIPAAHVFPAAWLEVQWRTGQADLDGPDRVRRFLLDDLGDIGFTPVRAIGAIAPFEFHDWPAWKVAVQGEYAYDEIEWVVFNAPEVNKTYAIGTTVVLPPGGIDPFAKMRDSFELPPGANADGSAPEPLPSLLPGPTLLGPRLGATFEGRSASITLRWESVKTLAPDEMYQVDLSYNYDEGSPKLSLTTRATHLDVPASLYHEPNCRVFNWQVRLVRKTGLMPDGRPRLEPVSFASLYAYFVWSRPPGDPADFLPLCPNVQF
jgi:hypothetical protein